MDRDIALQLSSKLNDIKTSLTALVTNTTPSPTSSASLSMSRTENLEDTEIHNDPVEEIKQEKNKEV